VRFIFRKKGHAWLRALIHCSAIRGRTLGETLALGPTKTLAMVVLAVLALTMLVLAMPVLAMLVLVVLVLLNPRLRTVREGQYYDFVFSWH